MKSGRDCRNCRSSWGGNGRGRISRYLTGHSSHISYSFMIYSNNWCVRGLVHGTNFVERHKRRSFKSFVKKVHDGSRRKGRKPFHRHHNCHNIPLQRSWDWVAVFTWKRVKWLFLPSQSRLIWSLSLVSFYHIEGGGAVIKTLVEKIDEIPEIK